MNHILSHFFVDEEDSPPLDIHINHESAIFDMYEYENYDILSSYFSRRFGRQLTYEEIDEKINNFFSGEKNYIQEEQESIQKNIKNFINFKESYLKQKRLKKEELKKLYLKGSKNDIKINNENNSSNIINILNENENDIINKENNTFLKWNLVMVK